MADVQAQAETTAVEETPSQTPSTEDNGSEADQNTSDVGGKEGDLRIPLREERQKRQTLETNLNDPDFILERAKALGLTEEETSPETTASSQTGRNAPFDVQGEIRFTLELEKAKEKYPELTSDDELGRMVTGLIQQGFSPLKAADTVFLRMNKTKEEARVKGIEQAKSEISDKEKAQTVSGTTQVSSEVEDVARLRQAARSEDRGTATRAQIELLKRKNKAAGIF